MTRSRLLLLAVVLATTSCDNGGADDTLGIGTAGVVNGRVYFDENGSRTLDAADTPVAGVRLALLAPDGRDTLVQGITGTDGTVRLADVPVGTYLAVIDPSSVQDAAIVIDAAPVRVRVLPGDSVAFVGAVSHAIRTTAQVRTLAPGTQVFVRAVALNARLTFSDSALHVSDTSGALRALRVRPTGAGPFPGDSLILRGRVATRQGQAVLEDVTAFVLAPTFVPAAATVSSAVAATAGAAGVRDASLVRLVNVLVTDTATVSGSMQLTVTDGSAPVVVVLDRLADAGFRAPLPAGLYVPTRRFDLVGVLTPTGGGAWRVKPRSALDLTPR